MELSAVIQTLIQVGASYPSNTDEHKAVLIAAGSVKNIADCFGAVDNPVLQAIRQATVDTAEQF